MARLGCLLVALLALLAPAGSGALEVFHRAQAALAHGFSPCRPAHDIEAALQQTSCIAADGAQARTQAFAGRLRHRLERRRVAVREVDGGELRAFVALQERDDFAFGQWLVVGQLAVIGRGVDGLQHGHSRFGALRVGGDNSHACALERHTHVNPGKTGPHGSQSSPGVLLRRRLLVILGDNARATFFPDGFPSPVPFHVHAAPVLRYHPPSPCFQFPRISRVCGVHQGEHIHGHMRLSPLFNGIRVFTPLAASKPTARELDCVT